MVCVLLREVRPLVRYVCIGEDRLNRALRLTGAAVDALVRMDVELILTLVDAVDGAHLDATRVFRLDAGLGDDIRHGTNVSG